MGLFALLGFSGMLGFCGHFPFFLPFLHYSQKILIESTIISSILCNYINTVCVYIHVSLNYRKDSYSSMETGICKENTQPEKDLYGIFNT